MVLHQLEIHCSFWRIWRTSITVCWVICLTNIAASLVIVNETVLDSCHEANTLCERWKLWWLLSSFTYDHRKAYNLATEENIFVVVAWVYAGDLKLLKLLPSVVKRDCTSHTNNEKCPHMTITGQTSSGNVFFAKQNSWCILFDFSQSVTKLVWRVIVKKNECHHFWYWFSGDSQLDNAIHDCFPRIQRVMRCGWHIVENGWQKNCPGECSVHGPLWDKFKQLLKVVKKWIYSWMKPGYCETEDEYHLSKVLLMPYLSSELVLCICGNNQ